MIDYLLPAIEKQIIQQAVFLIHEKLFFLYIFQSSHKKIWKHSTNVHLRCYKHFVIKCQKRLMVIRKF